MPTNEKINKKTKKVPYNHRSIELKWQAKWKKDNVYQPELGSAKDFQPQDSSKATLGRPFYNLMMFPYPSAEGLHVGSVYAFAGADVYGRFKRMQGHGVFEPIGLDGFGIHSENHAIKTNTHPIEHAKRTEDNFYRQLHSFGNSFAWDNKLETYSPQYYRWTQWLLVQLFKSSLAYRKKSPVNYCPFCKTVLADEQVIDGKCERCNSNVEKRELEQWYFRITNYAERLLNNIKDLNWTEKVKIAQTNWIGKSEGARVTFPVIASSAMQNEAISTRKIAASPTTPRNDNYSIEVFTTRPDTLHGATFMVISPEHPVVASLLRQELGIKNQELREIEEYVEKAKSKSEVERQAEGKEKTGVFSGLYAINPVNGQEIPIWIADYVLMGYGTGAIMAVPAHDQRDFEFARKFNLAIKTVIAIRQLAEKQSRKDGVAASSPEASPRNDESAYTGPGVLVNSGEWDGLKVPQEMGKVLDWLEEKGIGKREVNYHLRDWLISRQRYWGPPIPMIYCHACADRGDSWFTTKEHQEVRSKNKELRKGKIGNWELEIGNSSKTMAGWYPVPDDRLPVELPYVEDFKPMGTGKSPLANYPEFYDVKCPHCGADASRETDVSDTFLDSSWYFLRYLATDWDDAAFPSEKFFTERTPTGGESKGSTEAFDSATLRSGKNALARRKSFLPVTMYIGGAEHSVLHLLYARFITMVLHDLGYLDFEEPFSRFYAHGLIIKDGAKMSKSKGNVINPDDYIVKYGADTLRCYLQFLGPFNQGGDFRDSGIEGMHRFLKRVWTLFSEPQIFNFQFSISNERKRILHKTIKKVTEELEHLRYNTAIAALMEWYNYLSKQETISREEAEVYLKLLAPFAPHMTEELFQSVILSLSEGSQTVGVSSPSSEDLRAMPQNDKHFTSIHLEPWPTYEEKYLAAATVTVAVQVNGKLRGTVEIPATEAQNKEKVEALARADAGVAKFLTGTVKQVIYVPGKILNFVVT